MGGRTFAAAVAGALAVALAPAGVAQAAGTCSAKLERLTAKVPPVAHVGAPIDLIVGQDEDVPQYVAANVVAESGGVRVPLEVPADGVVTLPLNPPPSPGPFSVTLTWEQTASAARPDAPPCAARRVLPIMLVPVSDPIGDLDVPRVDGPWVVRASRGGRTTRSRLWLRALCIAGACDVEDAAYRWRFGADGRWRSSGRLAYAACGRGGTISVQRAYRVRSSWTLRPTASVTRYGFVRATRLAGELVQTFELTAQGREARCRPSAAWRWKVTAAAGI